MQKADTLDAVMLVGHGALLCGAGQVLNRHAERLRRAGLPNVEVAFLNYNEPGVGAALARLAARGAVSVVVLPYFLVPGRFVTVDLPRQIEAARAYHPGVEIVVADPLGYDARIAQAIEELAGTAHGPDGWRADLRRALSHCERRPSCPLFAESQCACPPAAPVAAPPRAAGGASALVVMAHGSPRASANESILHAAEDLRSRGRYAMVTVAYLECNEPNIPAALDAAAQADAGSVVAVPYFLHAGGHVAEDLPAIVEAAQQRHPHVAFLLAELLGNSPLISSVLRERAVAAFAARSQAS